jgi:hydrogen peroxide-dependent heme synthase
MKRDILTPLVLDGWFLLHQFFRLDPSAEEHDARSDAEVPVDFKGRAEELAAALREWEEPGPQGWTGLYRIIGGDTDYMLMHFRNSLEELGEAERIVSATSARADLTPTGDYLSVVELGMYGMTDAMVKEAGESGIETGSPEWDEMVSSRLKEEREKRYVQARLEPVQPEGMPYVCFYPMDKRRNVGQNWYTLPLAERAALMAEHGRTGRRYAGRISQIISGSVGFDDWEWAVTLFAGNPLDFKELVTEMRYDEVSALYAEFGSFWVGYRVPADRVVEEMTGS